MLSLQLNSVEPVAQKVLIRPAPFTAVVVVKEAPLRARRLAPVLRSLGTCFGEAVLHLRHVCRLRVARDISTWLGAVAVLLLPVVYWPVAGRAVRSVLRWLGAVLLLPLLPFLPLQHDAMDSRKNSVTHSALSRTLSRCYGFPHKTRHAWANIETSPYLRRVSRPPPPRNHNRPPPQKSQSSTPNKSSTPLKLFPWLEAADISIMISGGGGGGGGVLVPKNPRPHVAQNQKQT